MRGLCLTLLPILIGLFILCCDVAVLLVLRSFIERELFIGSYRIVSMRGGEFRIFLLCSLEPLSHLFIFGIVAFAFGVK